MSYKIRRIDYFYVTVKDQPGAAYQTLTQLAEFGVNLLAFAAVPTGPTNTQLTLFPEDTIDFQNLAQKMKLKPVGPNPAFMVSGKDELGALVRVHKLLFDAEINVFSSNGTATSTGSYGYLIYVRHEDYEKAANVLGV